jgi:hypothetical protein
MRLNCSHNREFTSLTMYSIKDVKRDWHTLMRLMNALVLFNLDMTMKWTKLCIYYNKNLEIKINVMAFFFSLLDIKNTFVNFRVLIYRLE